MGIREKAVTLELQGGGVWWRSSGEFMQWTDGQLPSVVLQLDLPPAEAQELGFVERWLGDGIVICHSLAFMSAPWSQMRDTIYHKGLLFMSYRAPSNSCMLFIPPPRFSSLLMKSPTPLPSARRCQAVQWVAWCLTKVQQARDVTFSLHHEF